MIATLLRGLIGLIGTLSTLLALRIWSAPVQTAANLGLSGEGLLGHASLRADLAGFFGAAGVLSLAAAVRNDRKLLTAPLIMIGLALSGRILTLGLEGVTQPQIQPLVIEAVLLVLLAAGRRNLGNR